MSKTNLFLAFSEIRKTWKTCLDIFFRKFCLAQTSTPGGYLWTKNSGIDAESARESQITTRTIRKNATSVKFWTKKAESMQKAPESLKITTESLENPSHMSNVGYNRK